MTDNHRPKPVPSPRPPSPPLEEPGTDPHLRAPVSKKEMRLAFRVNEIWTVIVAVATAGGALLGGYALFISKAEAAGEKAAAEVAKREDRIEERQKNVELDTRDLYKAVMYRQRSERLERPPADVIAKDGKDGGP